MNIILSPHFDDAVLSLGGLLAQENNDSFVATFFAGTPHIPLVRKWDSVCGFADSTQAMHERTLENKRSLNFLGISDEYIRNYTYLDAQYRLARGEQVPDESKLEAAIAQNIIALVHEFPSQPLKIFIPGLAMHIDHARVKNAACMAIKELLTEKNLELFFYQELPYAMSIMDKTYAPTIWNLFMRKDPTKWDYAKLQRTIADNSLALSSRIISLSAEQMGRKLAGIALYTSQVKHLRKQLLENIKDFSAAQARSLSLSAPFCEVVYSLN